MAAYAALVSVMQIIDQLERHPSPPISLNKQQVESLTQIVTFLQEFLEGYDSPFAYSDEADPLEIRIADAAYAAEDVIESYIVDVIQFQLRQSTCTHHPSRSRLFNFFRGHNDRAVPLEMPNADDFNKNVQEVIEEMDSIKKVVAELKREETAVQTHQPQRNIISSSSSTGNNSSIMVGFDDVLLQLLDNLTGGERSRQVIPITGMGGIGKTTLARNVFVNGLTKEHFDICAWITISQQYNTRDIICQILSQLTKGQESSEKSEEELGEDLHKYLFGRRYLVIMDDIWSIDVWEKMKFFFADCSNGSRIIVTTRLSYLTFQLTNSYALDMKFLDEANSWNLFFKTVFVEERICPPHLEKIGKKIVRLCRGLPLSIVVIGGLLAKSQHTQQHWEHIEQKLNSIVNSENDGYCLKILKLSYNHLPAYLKPSFLYMGIFEEDKRIHVSTLIRLWISEGFLKPENDKSLESIGRGFLKDLSDRNLILIDELGCTGNIKYCKMHDLLRDLCLKEGEKERFYHVIGKHSPQGIHSRRRLFYPQRSSTERVVDSLKSMFHHGRSSTERVVDSLKSMFNHGRSSNERVVDRLKSIFNHGRSSNERVRSMSHVRSLTSQYYRVRGFSKFRLLRILNANDVYRNEVPRYSLNVVIHELVNSRYLAFGVADLNTILPSSVNFLWNLHTLNLAGKIILPAEIWKMSLLRYVNFNFGVHLPDPPSGSSSDSRVMLENLETLMTIMNFKCGEEVVNIIPNIKKLRILYDKVPEIGTHDDYYCFRNVERLCKLESFVMSGMLGVRVDGFMQSLTFPYSLKKLILQPPDGDSLGWEKILEKVGSSLPLLEKLVLRDGWFTTGKWETVQGQFPNLKFLRLWACRGLKEWMIEESFHFPCLEKLSLIVLHQLEELPAEIGYISTLQSIELWGCSESAVKSAKKIVEEQEESQGQQLPFHVRVELWDKIHEELLTLATPNFNVKMWYS